MRLKSFVALCSALLLSACADKITNVTTTYVNEGPTAIEVLTPSIQMGASQDYVTIILTTIVGRTSAGFSDSTAVSSSNLKVGTAKRTSWGYYKGFDDTTKQSFVVVYENYTVRSGETQGETILTFTSAANPKITGKMNLAVCIGDLCKG